VARRHAQHRTGARHAASRTISASPMSTPHRISCWRIGSGVLMALLAIALLYQIWMFCLVVWYNSHNPDSTPIMREQLAHLQTQDDKAALRYQWVDYEHISRQLKQAVVASEDSRFVAHSGVEWEAIRQAWQYNLKQADGGSARRRGGSTITQQLAKNLFLSSSRSYLRKSQELILAYMIEHVMSKDRILELYLNVAEWGVGVFGAQAAARHYYNTSADKLGGFQAARLAAMLPNPRYYDKNRSTAFLNSRAGIIQRRMAMVEIPSRP